MIDIDAFHDIANAIARLRAAFLTHGMNAPISIELASLRDRDAFLYLMPRDMIAPVPRMGDTYADAEIIVHMMGVEIRMPAEWRRGLNGKKNLV